MDTTEVATLPKIVSRYDQRAIGETLRARPARQEQVPDSILWAEFKRGFLISTRCLSQSARHSPLLHSAPMGGGATPNDGCRFRVNTAPAILTTRPSTPSARAWPMGRFGASRAAMWLPSMPRQCGTPLRATKDRCRWLPESREHSHGIHQDVSAHGKGYAYDSSREAERRCLEACVNGWSVADWGWPSDLLCDRGAQS